MLFIAQASLLLKPLKLTGQIDLIYQGQDAPGQSMAHQFICEMCRQRHQLSTKWGGGKDAKKLFKSTAETVKD